MTAPGTRSRWMRSRGSGSEECQLFRLDSGRVDSSFLFRLREQVVVQERHASCMRVISQCDTASGVLLRPHAQVEAGHSEGGNGNYVEGASPQGGGVFLERSPSIGFGDDTCLIHKSFWKLAPSQMTLSQPPDVSRRVGQFPGTSPSGVRVDEHDSKAKIVPHVLHCACEIGVVGQDDGLLAISVEAIDQKTRGEIHVRHHSFYP